MPLLLGNVYASGFSAGVGLINNDKLRALLDEDLPSLF